MRVVIGLVLAFAILVHGSRFTVAQTAAREQDAQRCADEGSQGDPDKAIIYCDRALRNPDELSLDRLVYSLQWRGFAHLRKTEYASAIADLTQAIRNNPKELNLYSIRGGAYLAKGDFEYALQDYDHAIRLDPNFVPYSKAVALQKKGDSAAAIQWLGEVINRHPNDGIAYKTRGDIFKLLDRRADAIADYRKGISLNLQGAFREQAQVALRELGAAP